MRQEINAYIVNPDIKRRLKIICHLHGKFNYFDDVYQDYCVDILEGKRSKQTLDQCFIDYSRKKKWIMNKSHCRDLRPKFINIDNLHIGVYDKGSIDWDYILSLLNKDEKELIELYYKFNYTYSEIGGMFNYHETTSRNIINRILNKIGKKLLMEKDY